MHHPALRSLKHFSVNLSFNNPKFKTLLQPGKERLLTSQAAGLLVNILSPIYCRHRVALPPPGPPLSADVAIALIRSSKATAATLPPSTVDEIGKRPPLLATMAQLNYVVVGGGMVSKIGGDAVAAKTKMINILGTTEFGAFPLEPVDSEDWQYFHFSPLAGTEFRHISDEQYELVVVREKRLQKYQSCFEIFPDLQELSSHDLFSKHPTKSNLWFYSGRSDDVIVFLNGEKTNPVSMEELVSSRPEVRNALVVGHGRFEAALLIEPSHSSPLPVETRASLIEDLWPTIQEANMKCPAHARISKSRIFFTTPKKPMHRAAKGTVQRKFTLDDYSEEIDALYADDDHSHLSSDVHKLDLDSLEQHVLQIIRSTTDITDLNVEDDFFSRGVDSVQTIQIYRCLRSGLQQNRVVVPAFAPSTIYTNPTASQLAAALRKLLNKVQTAEDIDENKRLEEMNSMLNEYATSLPDARVYSKNIRKSNPRVVLLTGSTGSFGSYLLEALVTCESIQKIYCLNRSVDPKRRQIERSTSQGLSTQWDSERVVFLTGNLTEDCMGIERQQYTELLENLDLVIHNSWQVDFNLSLSSYNHHHVQGVRKLIDLSIASTRNAKIFFMSTVSAVNNWLFKHESPVPEEWIKDFTAPAKMGYAESKHVSEQLLFTANERCNVPIAICRVGQIAGPALGEKRGWNKREWLPSLIISSRHLGIIPDSLGKIERVDWIPIDIFSTIIMELALGVQATSESAPRVYHAVNPRVTTWNALLPCIKTGTDVKLEVVPLPVWVEKLRASAVATMTEEDFEANPALKLVEFYESLIGTEDLLPLLETGKAQERSPTLRALAPVNEHWIGRWMKQWRTA